MLVTFKTDSHGDVAMFGDIALELLKMMGHSGTVPGAIRAADIPAALDRLRAALDVIAAQPAVEQEDHEPAVSMVHRALPLVGLLTAASREGDNVMWV